MLIQSVANKNKSLFIHKWIKHSTLPLIFSRRRWKIKDSLTCSSTCAFSDIQPHQMGIAVQPDMCHFDCIYFFFESVVSLNSNCVHFQLSRMWIGLPVFLIHNQKIFKKISAVYEYNVSTGEFFVRVHVQSRSPLIDIYGWVVGKMVWLHDCDAVYCTRNSITMLWIKFFSFVE